MNEFEEAKDKLLMGAERRSMAMNEHEKINTAYHEAGHAIVGKLVPEHDGGFCHLLECALYTQLLDVVVGLTDTCGVDEAECHAVDVCSVFDDIPCGAMNVADNGLFLTHEEIEQGALAHIGLADNGHGNTSLDGLS